MLFPLSAWYHSHVNTVFYIFGSLPVYTFSFILGLGIAFGLIWSTWQYTAIPKLVHDRVRIAAFALPAALIGGRVVYVFINWVYFRHNLLEIPQIWLGGISWAGALAGSMLSLPLAARGLGMPADLIADRLFPLATSIISSTWIASWLAGYAYGIETQAWWGVPARDEWGTLVTRWPTQLVGALAALGIHWVVEQFQFRKWLRTPGLAASLEIAGLCLTIFALTPLRADSVPRWNGAPLDAWASIAFFLLSALIAVLLFKRQQILNKPIVTNNQDEN
jgi:prolipoprotein diacylglyceryltransferase